MPNMERFLKAQTLDYETALEEIKAGEKESHWMWYIFPQIKGLGMSEISMYYAIENIDEAKEYLRHPVLRQHLLAVSRALLKLDTCDSVSIFGPVDAMKLKSSMTLFHRADESVPEFTEVLNKYFDGQEDEQTLKILRA